MDSRGRLSYMRLSVGCVLRTINPVDWRAGTPAPLTFHALRVGRRPMRNCHISKNQWHRRLACAAHTYSVCQKFFPLIPNCDHTGNISSVGADPCVRPEVGAHAGTPLQDRELFLLL